MMKIYTKTGDKGETSLFGGKRVKKFDEQVEAYGNVDELTSYIGLVEFKVKSEKSKVELLEIQKDLYEIMAALAGAPSKVESLKLKVENVEKTIDEIEQVLPELRNFIIPGGTELSALFHIVRSVCRRAERNLVKLFYTKKNSDDPHNLLMVKYLNRLSDLFFILARKYNQENEIKLAERI